MVFFSSPNKRFDQVLGLIRLRSYTIQYCWNCSENRTKSHRIVFFSFTINSPLWGKSRYFRFAYRVKKSTTRATKKTLLNYGRVQPTLRQNDNDRSVENQNRYVRYHDTLTSVTRVVFGFKFRRLNSRAYSRFDYCAQTGDKLVLSPVNAKQSKANIFHRHANESKRIQKAWSARVQKVWLAFQLKYIFF